MVFRRNCAVVERWQGFPGGLEGKASACNAGDPGSIPESEDSLEKKMHPTPVLLPGKSHGRRSLEGCSPWGHKESDTTERLHFTSERWQSYFLFYYIISFINISFWFFPMF